MNNALITGVGPEQGLGAALCRKAAQKGLHVFVSGRTQEKIDAVVQSIEATGGKATAIRTDVTKQEDMNHLAATIQEYGRPLELAIYNAGNNRPEAFLDVTPEIFEEMWRVICYGGFLFAQALVPLMLAYPEHRHSLLFTGASGSLRGRANFAAFASGKGALRMMVQSLAREFSPQGIHVGHVVIDGIINGDKVTGKYPEYAARLGDEGMLNIEAIADNFWHLHQQDKTAWTQEIDLRPFKEKF